MERRKKLFPLLSGVLLVFILAGCGNPINLFQNDPAIIRLSTTTSVNDSGLLSYLQPEFERDTGFRLEITSAGSGAAIEKGRTGDADILLTHSPNAELAFIGEGFDEERVVFMYNFFVIVGPTDDPAGVRGSAGAAEAFSKIAEHPTATFVSRGDNSGTHVAENGIWDIVGITPTGQDWYISTGQGMGVSLNIAGETESYILTDKSTYLAHALRGTMEILLEKSEELQNIYSIIAISPSRWADTNKTGAEEFIRWMTSEKGQRMINEFGVAQYGEQLFFAKQLDCSN